jgi:hypothetical protein
MTTSGFLGQFDRIKAPAQAPSLAKFKARLEHLRTLDAIGPTEAWLAGVPPAGSRISRVRPGSRRPTTLPGSVRMYPARETLDEKLTTLGRGIELVHEIG